jgi:hypothetical protein
MSFIGTSWPQNKVERTNKKAQIYGGIDQVIRYIHGLAVGQPLHAVQCGPDCPGSGSRVVSNKLEIKGHNNAIGDKVVDRGKVVDADCPRITRRHFRELSCSSAVHVPSNFDYLVLASLADSPNLLAMAGYHSTAEQPRFRPADYVDTTHRLNMAAQRRGHVIASNSAN